MKRLRKPKLVPEARQWYRLFTVQGLAVIGAIQSVMLVVPVEWLRAMMPVVGITWADFGRSLTIAAAAFTAIGRLIQQPLPGREPEFEPTQPGDDGRAQR
jgi:hypothetical protein